MMRLFVRDLEFYGYHGASEEERKVGHRFRLNLEADVREEAGKSDRLADTLDYGVLAQAALEAATFTKYATLERTVDEIGNRILTRFTRVSAVRVRLAKLYPPIPLIVGEAGVEKTFSRT